VHHAAELEDGRTITHELVRELATAELEKIRQEIGDDEWFENEGRPDLSREIFEEVALEPGFVEFLTLPAGERLQEIFG
jgi:malate synthase